MTTKTSSRRRDVAASEKKAGQDLVRADEAGTDIADVGRSGEIVIAETPAVPTEALKAEEGLPALGSNAIFRSARQRKRDRWIRLGRYTLIPAVLAILWSMIFISPLYTSEVHFAVKAEAAAAGSGMTELGKGAAAQGMLGAIVDGFAVRDFLTAREAFNLLRKKIDYEKLMRVPTQPGLIAQALSTIGLAGKDPPYDTYQADVRCRFNITEQSVILRVYAYSSTDAQRIASQLVKIAEDFADRMNQRARQDWLHVMEGEMRVSEGQLAKVRTRLTQWRNKNATVDPGATATAINMQIAKLEETLTGAQTTYGQLVAMSSQSPRKVSLENTIKILTSQVADARSRLGGINGDKQFSQTIADYEALRVEQDSAERHLQTVRDTYELARIDTIKQQRYINTSVTPSFEPLAAYPQYYLMGLAGAGIGLTFLSVVSLLSSIRVDGSRKH